MPLLLYDLKDIVLPGIFAILPDKKKTTYRAMWKLIEENMSVCKMRYKLGSSAPKGKLFIIDAATEDVWPLLSFHQHGSEDTRIETHAEHLAQCGISEALAQTLIDAATQKIDQE